MSESIDKLQIEIQATSSDANKAINDLVENLGNLKKSISRLDTSKFKTLSVNTSNLSANTKKLSTSFNTLSTSATKSTKQVTSLASAFGTLYANFFWVIRGMKSLWNSIGSTANYIEAYNYFDVSLGKIGSDWSNQFEKYGYENAQAYAESFSERLQKDLGGLSGIAISTDASGNGLLTSTGMKNLGLNIQEITQYASQLASVTNSVGQTGEVSLATANAFTKLGADMSSLFNQDYSSVMKNLQSGLIGQSRALYKYGIDITNATLQTYAYNLGLSKAVSEMTQAEKMQLRLIAILDQSKVSWGDLANTINSPSNMLRQFTNNLKEAGMVLGQLFIPLLQKVMPVINGITIAIKNLLTSIAGFFGIKLDLSAFGQGFSGMEDDIDGVTDSLDDATASAKKFKGQLQGFDKLNVITTQSDSGGSSGSSVGGGIDLTDEILKATEEYQKAWDEAFAKMENKAIEFSKKVEKALEPVKQLFKDISIGDWFAVGQDVTNIVVGITDFFARAIASVEWEQVGNNIGNFIAGIDFAKILSSVGRLTWEAINASIELWGGSFDVSPIETLILSAIALLNFTPLGTMLATKIATSLSSAIASSGIINILGIGFKSLFSGAAFDGTLALFSTASILLAGIGSIIGGLGLSVSSFVSMFQNGFNIIKEVIMSVGIALTAVGAIILGANPFVAGVVAGIVVLVSTLVVVIKDNWEKIVSFFTGLGQAIKVIWDALQYYFMNDLFPKAKKEFENFCNAIKVTIEVAIAILKKLIPGIDVIFDVIAGVLDGIKTALSGVIKFISGVFTLDWEKAWNGVKDIFRGIFNGLISIVEGVINAIVVNGLNSFLKGFNGIVTNIGDVIGLDISIPQIKQISIPRFETGGFPEDGFFFANHNELVGQFSNGNTAVANNEQIVAGIKEGVREAVAEVLAPYLADIADSSRRTANKDFTVATRDIFDAVRTENRDYINRNGESAFAF